MFRPDTVRGDAAQRTRGLDARRRLRENSLHLAVDELATKPRLAQARHAWIVAMEIRSNTVDGVRGHFDEAKTKVTTTMSVGRAKSQRVGGTLSQAQRNSRCCWTHFLHGKGAGQDHLRDQLTQMAFNTLITQLPDI